MDLRALSRDPVFIGLFGLCGATAIYHGFMTREHDGAGTMMLLAAGCAILVLAANWRHWPWWQRGILGLAATILLADGVTYMQPDDCTSGWWKMATNAWTYVYLNIMGATRLMPLALAALGALGMVVPGRTRQAGLWALGCIVIVAAVDGQLHYVSDPDHCMIGE